jgi:hypothetical protein
MCTTRGTVGGVSRKTWRVSCQIVVAVGWRLALRIKRKGGDAPVTTLQSRRLYQAAKVFCKRAAEAPRGPKTMATALGEDELIGIVVLETIEEEDNVIPRSIATRLLAAWRVN